MKELIVTVPVVGITSAQISIQMEGVIALDTIVKQLLCCQVAISSNQQKKHVRLIKNGFRKSRRFPKTIIINKM